MECTSKMTHSLLLQFLSRLACMKDTTKIIYFDIIPTFFLGGFCLMILFLVSSAFSHYFNFASLRFIICLAFVINMARCGLADGGRHSWRAAAEGQPEGVSVGRGIHSHLPKSDVELKVFPI